MTYALERLAPGSYDVIRDGEVVAALVSTPRDRDGRQRWLAELLEDLLQAQRPASFVEPQHEFESLPAACAWLGIKWPA